jgi:hypothetical protein
MPILSVAGIVRLEVAMQIGTARALIGATYGLIGYLFGKLGIAAALVLCTNLAHGNLWAALMLAPVLASLGLVWMAARGLAGALGVRPLF